MSLTDWAQRWGVPREALRELAACHLDPKPQSGTSEAAVQVSVRLEGSRKGLRLWRNNVGVLRDDRGVPVRYGLANDSKAMNTTIKSSDLVGIRPLLIRQHHVGTTVGQFVAREIKASDWRYRGSKREEAQLHFIMLVASMGGDAAFATGEGPL